MSHDIIAIATPDLEYRARSCESAAAVKPLLLDSGAHVIRFVFPFRSLDTQWEDEHFIFDQLRKVVQSCAKLCKVCQNLSKIVCSDFFLYKLVLVLQVAQSY